MAACGDKHSRPDGEFQTVRWAWRLSGSGSDKLGGAGVRDGLVSGPLTIFEIDTRPRLPGKLPMFPVHHHFERAGPWHAFEVTTGWSLGQVERQVVVTEIKPAIWNRAYDSVLARRAAHRSLGVESPQMNERA